MAESNSVRLLQHHLRQAGTLLAARQFDSAASHVEAALEIDPMSPSALTLRDRLESLRAQTAQTSRGETPVRTVEPAASTPRFVPSGVNAASWLDFEQRVQDRRFRALIESAERAVAASDVEGARSALEEARELRPDAGDIARMSTRIAMLQMPAAAKARDSVLLSRTFRAATLLLVGVTLLMGLDWVRSAPSGRGAVPETAAAASSAESSSDVLTVPERSEEVVANPETLGTSGSEAEPPSLLSEGVTIPLTTAPVVAEPRLFGEREAPVPSAETPDDFFVPRANSFPRTILSNPLVIRGGEVPDDYVAPRRDPSRDTASVNSTLRGATPPTALASIVRQPAPLAEPVVSSSGPASLVTVAPPAVPFAAAAVIAPSNGTVAEESRVRRVIDQYASAYGQLNAAGVRSVWPSVDERALAKAFADLSAQSVSFDDCDISVIGLAARASCRGPASYVRKYGSQEPHKERHTVRFELKREGDVWKIQKAETRK